jgi:hypothetical protein
MKTRFAKKLKLSSLLILVSTLLLYQNCSFNGMRSLEEKSTPPVSVANYEPTNLTKAIVSAAKTFANRLPTAEELQKAASGVTSYRAVVQSYIESTEFRSAMVREHQNYLEIGGTIPTSTIDFDQPARLGTYLIVNNRDYSQVLQADYCIDQGFQTTAFCDTFTSIGMAYANAAGILTMRAYIATHKPKKAFNFRIVNDSFDKFNCSAYPDLNDTRAMQPSQISSKVHPWGSSSACYDCHKTMNPKAYLFYFYGVDGRFTGTNPSGTTKSDSNQPSLPEDVIVPGNQPTVDGLSMNSVKDLGKMLAADSRFGPCMARRYVNFMLGKNYDSDLPSGMTYLSEVFTSSGNNVKKLLLEIATSAAYVNRGDTLQTTGSGQ